MKKILDKMFFNKKWCMSIPILLAAAAYLLFILFGSVDNKLNSILALPIISAIWFFGVFFVVYAQVKNKMCPERFLNLLELLVALVFGIEGVISLAQFIIGGFRTLDFGLCMGLVTYSAVCWAHSKREND